MRAARLIVLPVLLAGFFAAGFYGAPLARIAYAKMFPEPAFVAGDYSSIHRKAGSSVVMFSTTTCPYCAKTRALFAKAGVAYVDYTIDTSAQAKEEFERLGGGGVPLIYIGDRRIHGFREDAIRDALARQSAPSG
jgi:glutaredoxin